MPRRSAYLGRAGMAPRVLALVAGAMLAVLGPSDFARAADEPLSSILVGRWQGGQSNSPLYVFASDGTCAVNQRQCVWSIDPTERRTMTGGRISTLRLAFDDGAQTEMQLHVYSNGTPGEYGIALNNEAIPRVVGMTAREQAVAEATERERQLFANLEAPVTRARQRLDAARTWTERRDALLAVQGALRSAEAVRRPQVPEIAAEVERAHTEQRLAVEAGWTSLVAELERFPAEVAEDLRGRGVDELTVLFAFERPDCRAWLRRHGVVGLYSHLIAILVRRGDAREAMEELGGFVPEELAGRVAELPRTYASADATFVQARHIAIGIEQLASEVVGYCSDYRQYAPTQAIAERDPSPSRRAEARRRLASIDTMMARRRALFGEVGIGLPNCDQVHMTDSVLASW